MNNTITPDMITLTAAQARLASAIAYNALLNDTTYVETGRYKTYSANTVTSLIGKGLAKIDHPSRCNGVYHMIADGNLAEIIAEVVEWCYGDCMSFLDERSVDYSGYMDNLTVYQALVIDVKIGKLKGAK